MSHFYHYFVHAKSVRGYVSLSVVFIYLFLHPKQALNLFVEGIVAYFLLYFFPHTHNKQVGGH